MKEIQLSHGYFTAVDDDDYERLSQYLWIAVRPGPDHVIAVRTANGRLIYMHREIMSAEDSESVHHIDGDRLNNKKTNLIIRNNLFTRSGKTPNVRPMQKQRHDPERKSNYSGVKWDTKRSKWYAYTQYVGTETILGRFKDEVDAAREYDLAIIRMNLHLPTNFPPNDYIKVDKTLVCERRCVVCGAMKSPEEFYTTKTEYGKARKTSRCKTCLVTYSRDWARKRRKRIREEIVRMKDVPCADCGVRYSHYIMQFHHLDPSKKVCKIGEINSVRRLLSEARKCIILCSNCHLEREWGENGLSRKRWGDENPL